MYRKDRNGVENKKGEQKRNAVIHTTFYIFDMRNVYFYFATSSCVFSFFVLFLALLYFILLYFTVLRLRSVNHLKSSKLKYSIAYHCFFLSFCINKKTKRVNGNLLYLCEKINCHATNMFFFVVFLKGINPFIITQTITENLLKYLRI